MRGRALLPMAVAAMLAGCGQDDPVPTSADNAAMDSVANGLDNAATDLSRLDAQLPDANESGPPAKANSPPSIRR